MSFTPVVRWKNFTTVNLTDILKIYPKWEGEVTFDTFNNFMNDRLPSYQRTAYQFAGQLGLVDRSDTSNLQINNYLDFRNTNQLNAYLIFWFKTYYGPNPYISSSDSPFIFYKELIVDILASPTLKILYSDFLVNHTIDSGSNDILLNAIKSFAAPVQYNSVGELFITDVARARHEVALLDTYFSIPPVHNSDAAFFNRYNQANFELFKRLFISPSIDKPHNRLINGAPGTGKSHMIQDECENYLGTEWRNFMERETFHLTYSYQQFVGTYKPVPFGTSITYEYVPGPFLRLLVKAIKDFEKHGEFSPNYIFVIEEINRAKNPDAVFGNVFQLLDRNSDGSSKYEITCTEDMKRYFNSEGLGHLTSLYLPPNFYIWATMNNADQGVQAIDSAFFRRWEPKYISINNNENKIKTIEVNIEGYGKCNWNNFRKELNSRLLEIGIKEDKLIGPFFIDPTRLTSNFDEVFVNKLLRYLFEDVLKFKRDQLFGAITYFQQAIDEYKSGSLTFIGLNKVNFEVI